MSAYPECRGPTRPGLGQRALHEPAAPAPPTRPPVTARDPPLQVTHESPWRRRSSFGMCDVPLPQLDLDSADLPVSEVWWFYIKLIKLWDRNIMMGMQSLGDGRIFGGKITRAFGSKVFRPDLSTKFWTLKELQFCSSRSETLLQFRHQRIFKIPPNLLSFYWKVQPEIQEIWIKCYLTQMVSGTVLEDTKIRTNSRTGVGKAVRELVRRSDYF